MRVNFKLIFLFILYFPTQLNAQLDSINSFNFLGDGFDKNWIPNSIKLVGNAELGSNTINSTMFSDFLIRESFTPKAKNQYLNLSKSRTNLAVQGRINFEFKMSEKLGLYVFSNRQVFLSISNDYAKMLLFGNAQFAGKNIETSKSEFLNLSNHTLGVSHLLFKSNKVLVKTNYGINLVTQFNKLKAKSGSIFTEQDGDYIDFNIRDLEYTESENSIQGFGLDLGMMIYYQVNKTNELSFGIHNIQPTRLFNATTLLVDTSFRFEGIEFNPFGQDSSESFSNYLDSSIRSITGNEKDKKYVLLPSQIKISWGKSLNDKNKIVIQASTIQYGSYGFQLNASHKYFYGPRLIIQSTASYGNYSSLQWNESLEYRPTEKMSVFGSFIGINSMLAPTYSSSYGIVLGVSNRF